MRTSLPRFRSGLWIALLALAPCPLSRAEATSAAASRAAETVLSTRARDVLLQILPGKTSWEQLHAAEALVICGEGNSVHQRFAGEANGALPPWRTSVWRMLAWTAKDAPERRRWMARIEEVLLLPAATDRSTAIEILSKFHHRLEGPYREQAQRMAADPVESNALFGWWALAVDEDPAALPKIAAALQSKDPGTRARAGSVLRWLRPNAPAILAALAQAADREELDSAAFTSVVGAAVMLNAAAGHAQAWRAKLEEVVKVGPGRARWSACQALMLAYTPADLPKVARFLDAPDNDSRTGAAWAILHVLGLPRASAIGETSGGGAGNSGESPGNRRETGHETRSSGVCCLR